MKNTLLSNYKTLIPYLYRYRFQYIAGFFCLILVDGAQVVIPFFLKQAVDIIADGGFTVKQIMSPALAMLALMTLISGGRFLWRYFINGSSRRIEAEMRSDLFERLLTLSYDFFQKNKIGDLMSRATNDLNAARMSIGMGLVALVDGTVMAVSILVIIFITDAKTALFTVIPLPLITLLILLFGKLAGKRFQKAQEAFSSMSGAAQETFAGVRVVKSFAKEWFFLRKFADTNDEYRKANMDLVKLYGVFFPLISFFSGLTSGVLLLTGGVRVIQGALSAGELTALFRYFQMLIWPLMGAGFTVHLIQRGAVSLGRINEVMHAKPLIVSPEKSPPPNPSAPFIEVRGLSFSYTEGVQTLENVSFVLEKGEWLGVLGRAGSGKTTLIKTLTRLIDPPPNTVFIKGIDARDWNLKELRGLFGVTPQDSFLFSDSIKNNIAYGLENAPQQLVENAASLSAVDKDLAGFSQGFDTVVGERGLTLSGGQKQRVSISRALIKDNEAFILDDALSSVDSETERRILNGLLGKKKEKKTLILISHRVSALCTADKVLVLDEGKPAEYGTPAQLLAADGFFAKTARLQSLEKSGEAVTMGERAVR